MSKNFVIIDGKIYLPNAEDHYEPAVNAYYADENPIEIPEELEGHDEIEVPGAKICSADADKWTDGETRFMLSKYEVYMAQVGPKKRFKNKNVMWATIATEMSHELQVQKTGQQVKNRYATVLRRKKAAVDNNATSGSSRQDVPFEDVLKKIASADDSIQPEVLRSVNKVQYLKVETSPQLSPSSKPKKPQKRTLSVQETLEKLHEAREEAKRQRHQERMDFLREIFKKD